MSQSQINELIKIAVNYCHQRNPELLDKIFDNLPVEFNKQVLVRTVAALQGDTDSLAWFCGYFAGTINRSEDNEKPQLIVFYYPKCLLKTECRRL